MKSELRVGDCAKNYNCLSHTDLFNGNGGDDSKYINYEFCPGKKCVHALFLSILDYSMFTVLGVLEEFERYLSLLECAYPRLRGILKIYKEEHVVANKGKMTIEPPPLVKIINQYCNQSHNTYAKAYEMVLYHSRILYDNMMKHGGKVILSEV